MAVVALTCFGPETLHSSGLFIVLILPFARRSIALSGLCVGLQRPRRTDPSAARRMIALCSEGPLSAGAYETHGGDGWQSLMPSG